MTRPASDRSSRGQVLIMVAASMLVLMAIAALVIDLGFSWMLRRHEQNAADPAAIAAARWLVDDDGDPRNPFPEAYAEACSQIQKNGFFESDDASCSAARAAGDLQVNSPPVGGPYSARAGYMQVIIRSTHPSFFSRVFSGADEAVVTTGAVAANTAGQSNSNSLIALNPDGCDTGMVQGTGGGPGAKVSIVPALDPDGVPYDGGYVYSNSACPPGFPTQLAFCGGGSGSVKVSGSNSALTAPKIYTVGTCAKNGAGATITTNDGNMVNQGAVPIGDPLAPLPRPRLSDFPNGLCPNGVLPPTPSTPTSTSACTLSGTGGGATCPSVAGQPTCVLTPGVYYGGFVVGSKVRLQLQPGMYILAGGGIRLSGVDASIETVSNGAGTEPRVTIFSTDGPGCPGIAAQCQGEIRFNASQDFRAKATNLTSCQAIIASGGPNTCPWRGILLWQDGTASHPTAPVSIGGQATNKLAGTIYAPLAHVDIAGGSNTTGCTSDASTVSCLSIQVISWEWKIVGNATVEMPYDPSELYQLDQRGLVH